MEVFILMSSFSSAGTLEVAFVAALKIERNMIAVLKIQPNISRLFHPQERTTLDLKREAKLKSNEVSSRFVNLL